MKKNIFAGIALLSISTAGFAYTIDSLKISNNSNVPVSFYGDNNECIAQTNPRTISEIPSQDFQKLCKSSHCTVRVYSNYSCSSSHEYFFDFNSSYGVSGFSSNAPNFIRAEGYQNHIFISNK